MYVIALDVGGTSIKSALVDTTPQVLEPVRQTPINNSASAPELLGIFSDIVHSHVIQLAPGTLIGLAAAFPNPFNYQTGISQMQHKYQALYELNMGASLRVSLPSQELPVAFRNDAEAAVLGEALYGAGRGLRRVIGVTLGTGLGACFIDNGRVLRSGHGVPDGGELYHLLFHGTPADDLFSIRGVQARLQAVAPKLTNLRDAGQRADKGDKIVQGVFAAFGHDLGSFLQPYLQVFNADALLVLGGISGAGRHFLPALQKTLTVPAHVGSLGAHAALLGAAQALNK